MVTTEKSTTPPQETGLCTLRNESADAAENLDRMVKAVEAVVVDETDLIAALANISAVLMAYLGEINWAGFYIQKGNELVLGPFQGLPACTRIGAGKGVCGKAAAAGKTVIVPNVHEFPGHIACDSASASEIVIPLFRGGRVYGVLDVDSPRLNRFSPPEAEALNRIGDLISAFLDRYEH
ncbi:MAG: GAF domain-containing protein [Spirochaetaceae bacterium]|jgi:GAF domain-containing protein|nr:GAF domain-containing protein [Spirochaetaceae bacterium]